MSFAKTLSRLKKASDCRPHGVNVNETFVSIKDLRDLIRDWERLDAKSREPGQVQTWIACSERMPEPCTVVALLDANRRMNTACEEFEANWTGAGWLNDSSQIPYWNAIGEPRGLTLDAVTHWMGLPPMSENGDS